MAKLESIPTTPDYNFDPYKELTTHGVAESQPLTTSTSKDLWQSWLAPVYIGHFLAILVMIIWPWAFFGVVLTTPGGLGMPSRTAHLIQSHTQDTTYIITAIASVLSLIVGYFLSTSVTTLAIKLVASHVGTNVFALSFVSAFRSPSSTFTWVWSSRSWLVGHPGRLSFAFIGLLYFVMFLLATSAFNALLTPQPITRSAGLEGTELDFGSTDPDCMGWYNNNLLPDGCNWAPFNGSQFTTCLGENQMVDVLESGRNNIISLFSNNTDSVTFSQLGGLHFLGPISGVLPIGPNGVSAFNNISSSPLSDGKTASATSYNYTLNQQGLVSNVSCSYGTSSPIVVTEGAASTRVYNGTCAEGDYVLDNPGSNPMYSPPTYLVLTTENALSFWACNATSSSPGSSYTLYFRGEDAYAPTIGNITCTITSARPALVPVTYRSDRDFFSVGPAYYLSPQPTNEFIDQAVRGLGELVWNAQALQFNAVAESIITMGVKNFGLGPYTANEEYLALVEAMVQGVLEYQATYARLIYTTYNAPGSFAPDSCMRNITGTVTYSLIGWRVTPRTAGFLIPLTIVNLTSLFILLTAALFVGEPRKLPRFDPTNTVSLLVAASRGHLVFPKTAADGGRPGASTGGDGLADAQVLDMKVRYGKVGDVYALQSVGTE